MSNNPLSVAPLFFAVLLCACVYREPSALSFTDRTVLAMSKQAQSGEVPLEREGRFRWALSSPAALPPNSSLVLSYALPASFSSDVEVVFEIEKKASFVLPLDVSFLAPGARAVRYAVPADFRAIGEFGVYTKGGAPVGTSIIVSGLSIEPRGFGFALREDGVLVTPYVEAGFGRPAFAGESPSRSVIINPPKTAWVDSAEPAEFALKLEGIGPGAFFQTDVRRRAFIAGRAAAASLSVPGALLGESPFPIAADGGYSAVLVSTAPAPAFPREAVTVDPSFILDLPQKSWRDARYEVFRWDVFPSILIFDTAGYDVQDRMLKRIAFFAEKKGYRGKIATDAELEDKHGWNAHDYRAETLSDFFNAVRKTNIGLNTEERELREILIASGIIAEKSDGYEPGTGAIVSISRESSPELRVRFLVHECYHGIFFLDEDFRKFAEERYDSFNKTARAFIRSYFDYLAYDIGDRYLMINEFMAYILQQHPDLAADYFGKYAAGKLEESDWRKSVLPEKNEETGTWPLLEKAFAAEAEAFSAYVFSRWGCYGGRIARIRREKDK